MHSLVHVFVLPLYVIKSNGERAIFPPTPRLLSDGETGLFDRAFFILSSIPVVVVVARSFVVWDKELEVETVVVVDEGAE